MLWQPAKADLTGPINIATEKSLNQYVEWMITKEYKKKEGKSKNLKSKLLAKSKKQEHFEGLLYLNLYTV